jgi:hypothetical protein
MADGERVLVLQCSIYVAVHNNCWPLVFVVGILALRIGG